MCVCVHVCLFKLFSNERKKTELDKYIIFYVLFIFVLKRARVGRYVRSKFSFNFHKEAFVSQWKTIPFVKSPFSLVYFVVVVKSPYWKAPSKEQPLNTALSFTSGDIERGKRNENAKENERKMLIITTTATTQKKHREEIK